MPKPGSTKSTDTLRVLLRPMCPGTWGAIFSLSCLGPIPWLSFGFGEAPRRRDPGTCGRSPSQCCLTVGGWQLLPTG